MALVPVVGQSWPIKDVVSLLSRKPGCGKAGQRKDWKPILRSSSLEGKRQEKAFEQAMVESPMGGIYEAQPAAEPGESVIFKTMNSVTGGLGPDGVFGASVVEVLKPEFFAVAPEARSEGYQHQIPRLKKDKVKWGYAHHGKTRIWGFGGLLWPRSRMNGPSFTFLFHRRILQTRT